MGPRAGLDGCRKSRPPPSFDLRTVQPVSPTRLRKKNVVKLEAIAVVCMHFTVFWSVKSCKVYRYSKTAVNPAHIDPECRGSIDVGTH